METEKKLTPIIVCGPMGKEIVDAVSMRLHHLNKTLENPANGFDLKILDYRRSPQWGGTICAMPKNTHSLSRRLFLECLLGFEVALRLYFGERQRTILLSSPPYFTTLIVGLFMAIAGRNYILDMRDIYPEVFFESKLLDRKNPLIQLLQSLNRFLYGKAKMIFTVTPGCKRMIESYLDLRSKASHCKILRNGYPQGFLSSSSQKNEKFQVLFHGNLGRFQDIPAVLECAKQVGKLDPMIQFVVAGAGHYETLLKTHSLSNLTYLGSVSSDEIGDLLASSHLGISFRSDDEISRKSFPVKIYEYIGAGLPWISAPASEVGDFVQATGAGIEFSKMDIGPISEYIVKMANDSEYYQQAVAELERVRPAYSRERLSLNAVEEISQCLQRV